MTNTFYGTAYVASHIGSSQASVTNWSKNPTENFPQPAVIIVSPKGTISARGWSADQLPELRTWMGKRLGLTDERAKTHWKKVDQSRRTQKWAAIHGAGPGQEMLDL